MAASSKVGGYKCEFLGAVSEDFVCGICKHVAREPHLTGCCGMTVCKACITPVSEDKKPCPSCGRVELAFLFNVRDNQRILALEVRCTMKDRGCEWTGKLEGLEAHLDVSTGDCEYVDVECPNKCDQAVEKRNLPSHLTNSCPKREFTCQHCNFKATYEVVSNDHWPQCSFYPVPCPNACGIQAIERGDLDAHLLQCSLEVIKCDFSHAGCNTKLPRQDMERHVEESTQKHLVLMSAKSLRLEQRLQEQQETFQEQRQETAEKLQKAVEGMEQLQKMAQENEAKINDLQQQLQQKAQQVDKLERFMSVAVCTPNIKMDDFKQHKDKQDTWLSPPLYTHPGGYKFCIPVYAYGRNIGTGTHVAVSLYAMKGEFDNQLQWPVKCTITLQLLNQQRDQDHITKTGVFQWNKTTSETESVAHFSSTFSLSTFIAHAELEYNRHKQTRYLKNDCLLFQVTKVELK